MTDPLTAPALAVGLICLSIAAFLMGFIFGASGRPFVGCSKCGCASCTRQKEAEERDHR